MIFDDFPSLIDVEFPAGILQGQFLSALRPEYLNYGAIGQIIGHEITHGFDDQGRQFDEHGNLVDWWKTQTKERFLNRTKCIIDQYGNFSDPVLNMTVSWAHVKPQPFFHFLHLISVERRHDAGGKCSRQWRHEVCLFCVQKMDTPSWR